MRLVRLYPVDLFLGDAVRVVDEAPRIRQGEHLAAKLDDLFRRVGRDIARAGDYRGLADQILLLRRQHVGQEINGAIAGRLGAGQIGRASSRERVCPYVSIKVVEGALKNKKQNK